jgi:hypothetical protein
MLVVVTALLAPMMPHHAYATLVFRFDPNNLQVPLPEPPQPSGLQVIDAEIGIADEALSRGGNLQLSDLEYARYAYTPLPDEFGSVSPASFEFGERFGTGIVTAGTEFEVRTGYASWTGVSISGDTLVFNPPGVFLSVADTCFDLIGQVFCEGSKGGAIITRLEEGSDPALVEMLIRDEFAACNEFLPTACNVSGRFVLVDAATQIAEPPALAFLGLIMIGLGLRQRAPRG